MLKTEEKVVNGGILSSEDEDGFPLDKKRKRKAEPAPEPAIAPNKDVDTHNKTEEEETPKKKKKNKKKKKKETKEEENISEDAQSKQNNGNLVVGDDAQALGKKGTVKKYSNGLEIVNVSMGTPDGRQATRGKKVRTCYMFIDNMIIWKLCMRL